ncbi:MAG: SDR family NAD(P)-dependent oxidoreductase, partial [Eubacterium callanderi]
MNHQKNTMSEKPVIAVTGGGQGIGRAILLYFTERGYNAAVLDMNLETAAAVAEECKARGADAIAVECNVTDSASVNAAYDQIGGYFGGRLDVQVNNAGVFRRERVEDATDDVTDLLIDVNLRGPVYTSRAAIKIMKEQGHGSII